MREFARWCRDLMPLQFRVLYRQFLLRVVDLEALSIEADVPRFLGQFAGILIFVSLFRAIGTLWSPPPPAVGWQMEQSAIVNTMLVVGLIAVVTWDSTFPDRRDAMVLGPLPVKPRMILTAKLAATAALLGIAIASLNFASSIAWALVFGGSHGPGGFLRFFVAHWFTLIAASAFLYGSVLTVQGMAAFLLPRRLFLKLSAILQLAAFGLFFSVYFLASSVESPASLGAMQAHSLLAANPALWFFAVFEQCNEALPNGAEWLARRGWLGLGCAITGASVSLLLCYLRTMRKTVEQPDLVPAGHGLHWNPRVGNALQSAVLLFTFRAIRRSRQHRVILAFFYAITCACALSLVHRAPRMGTTAPMTVDFIILTIWMMFFAVLGFRAIFPLPISLTANWVLRITQLRAPEDYIAAVRRSLLVLAVAPVWITAALLALSYRPVLQVAAHLTLLLFLGLILADFALISFYKIPFTCSHLPGKSNLQFAFWTCLVGVMLVALFVLNIEIPALQSPVQTGILLLAFAVAAGCLYVFNRRRAKSAVLYFEELPTELITQLGVSSILPPAPDAKRP